MKASQVKEFLEYAPKDPGRTADHLRGHWFNDGDYICSTCAGRLAGRGLMLPAGSIPVWDDTAEPCGVCCGCEMPENYGHNAAVETARTAIAAATEGA